MVRFSVDLETGFPHLDNRDVDEEEVEDIRVKFWRRSPKMRGIMQHARTDAVMLSSHSQSNHMSLGYPSIDWELTSSSVSLIRRWCTKAISSRITRWPSTTRIGTPPSG